MTRSLPPASVLGAFGVVEPPRKLAGGQGVSWVAGDLVLKPESGAVHDWFADASGGIVGSGFRLASPVRSRFGTWSFEGWSATTWVSGSQPDLSSPEAWEAILTAGRAFHRATAHLSRPAVLADRGDWWALADQAAWGEREIDVRPEFAWVARRLDPLLQPLGASQLVHADLTLNVLVEPDLDPAIIDVSPYWRPVAYADGVVVADALCWHGAERALLEKVDVPIAAVARALLFRIFTTAQRVDAVAPDLARDELQRYDHAVALLGV